MRKYSLIVSFVILIICAFLSNTPVYATETEFSEPKLVVSSYEIIEGTVANGEEFTIKVYLSNMNQHVTAYNVVTSMTSANNNVVIVDGKSNTVYFDIIEPGNTVDFTMRLKMLDLDNNGLAVVSFVSTCYNPNGYENNMESRLTLTAENQAQLDIPSITVSENAVVGANALVSVRYSNTGDSKLSNIKMKIEGNIEEGQKVAELGNLEADAQKYTDYYVTFTEDGDQALNISFEYQDKVGNIHEISGYEYSLNVYPYVVSEDSEYVLDTEKIKLGMKEVYMLIVGGVLLLALMVAGIIKISPNYRKKTRK